MTRSLGGSISGILIVGRSAMVATLLTRVAPIWCSPQREWFRGSAYLGARRSDRRGRGRVRVGRRFFRWQLGKVGDDTVGNDRDNRRPHDRDNHPLADRRPVDND